MLETGAVVTDAVQALAVELDAWRFAYATVTGTRHLRDGCPGQDASRCVVVQPEARPAILVACVADGAGSAARGGEGADLACDCFLETVESRLPDLVHTPDVASAWLKLFQARVAERAASASAIPRDFACTFLAAVVREDRVDFLQIGDGAIVVDAAADPDGYAHFVWPRRGEYANETFFATDPAASEHLEIGSQPRRVAEIALLTDGLQSLVLDYRDEVPHAPFFRRMFAPVRAAAPGHAAPLSRALAAFLASPRVRERTDDDTTLVLATRRGLDPIEPAAQASHGEG